MAEGRGGGGLVWGDGVGGGRDSSARHRVLSFTGVKSSGGISPHPSGKRPTGSAVQGRFAVIGCLPPSIVFNALNNIFHRLVPANHLPSSAFSPYTCFLLALFRMDV